MLAEERLLSADLGLALTSPCAGIQRAVSKPFACLVAIPLFLAGCQAPAPTGFVEGTTLGVVAHSPKQVQAIFLNSHTGEGMATFPEDEWATVDVSHVIPAEATAVYLSGLLIITHGTVEGVCDLTLAYRNHGETDEYSYSAQTIEAAVNAGKRTPHSIWIPVRDGRFQIKWHRSTTGSWPEHCAYGINLNLVAYLR